MESWDSHLLILSPQGSALGAVFPPPPHSRASQRELSHRGDEAAARPVSRAPRGVLGAWVLWVLTHTAAMSSCPYVFGSWCGEVAK